MKKLLSTLLLAAAVPATMLARPIEGELLKTNQMKFAPQINSTFLKADAKINPAMLADKQGKTVMFDTIPSHGWYGMYSASNFTNEGRVIQYDEYSDAVYVLHNHFTLKLDAADPEDETRGVLRALVYTNGGTVEGPRIEIFNQVDKLMWGATFDLVNPNKETDPNKMNFMAFSSLSRGFTTATKLFVNGDPAFCLFDPAKLVAEQPTRITKEQKGPAGDANYPWDDLNILGFTNSGNNVKYIAGAPLFSTEASMAMSGKYGFATIDNSEYHDFEISGFPTEFAQAKFSDPELRSHSNSPVFFGKDKNNKLYAFVNNNHKAIDVTKRLPAFAISDNDGASWGAFDIMPWSVFDNYVKPHVDGTPTEDLAFGFQPFNGTDFLLQENGDFSYVAKLYAQDKQTNKLFVFDIVEVYREAGVWGIRQVEDMRFLDEKGEYRFASLRTIYEGGVDPVDGKLIYATYPRNNELELAITKDRKYLVMKWLDYKFTRDANGVKEYVDGDTNVVVNLQYKNTETEQWTEEEIRGYTPTAIYVKYREIGTNTWSEAVQLTNDERYHLHTHMPDMVPSLEKIPIVSSLTIESYPATLTGTITTLPKLFREMSYNDLKFTYYGVYNAKGTSSVVNDSETSKDDVQVYPNPASNSLTVACDANSTVEIFNTLGEKMMDVKGNTANISSLANGIYLVKVTKDGKVSSTLFTVAK